MHEMMYSAVRTEVLIDECDATSTRRHNLSYKPDIHRNDIMIYTTQVCGNWHIVYKGYYSDTYKGLYVT